MNQLMLDDVYEGNLKHISLGIPKQQLVVLCGVSGSGKSTLAVDVIFQECQRQYLEALGMQGISKPKMASLRNGAAAILISQNNKNNHNPRSYVGTSTDIYTDLRMVYEKLGSYPCPYCNTTLLPYQCHEHVVKDGTNFHVYQNCPYCHKQMDKLTRSHFSYNTEEGACPHCQGLGESLEIAWDTILDESKSLEEGACSLWTHNYLQYQIEVFYQALSWYQIPFKKNMPIYTMEEQARYLLKYGIQGAQMNTWFSDIPLPKNVAQGRFEGIAPMLWRKVQEKGKDHVSMQKAFKTTTCPLCHGERLNEISRQVLVRGQRLPEISTKSIEAIYDWILQIKKTLSVEESLHVEVYLDDILTKCKRLMSVGLSYLSLDRKMATLSGGEMQRLKLAAALDCELSGLLYILDEPTIGLHPHDIQGMIEIIKDLQKRDNSVLVIEHDPLFLKHADHIIEIGPQAGAYGGEIIFAGSYEELKSNQIETPTSLWLNKTIHEHKARTLSADKVIIKDANIHNLHHFNASLPIHGMIGFTGVSGSGKSTLVFDVIGAQANCVSGLESFTSIQSVDQHVINRSIRSNVATYSGVYTHIRNCFAKQAKASNPSIDAKSFSFNSKGGRCERCDGLGQVISNRLFFADIPVPCPICHGKRFQDFILAITYKGYSIADILEMEVRDADTVFDDAKIKRILTILLECGLGYLKLGQDLTTLSGGEAQRLKFATDLLDQSSSNTLYLLDEPTTGLHPQDIEHFLVLVQRLVDQGNTIYIVEHNAQIVSACDYIVDLGPGGGIHGGHMIAHGTVNEIKQNKNSITGVYLAN